MLQSVSPENAAQRIKEHALSLGFSAVGIARAEAVPDSIAAAYREAVAGNRCGTMSYLDRNHQLRTDPTQLLAGTRSIISVALNYYPALRQSPDAPQLAYYAYGKDYHKVVKRMLDKLLLFIRTEIDPEAQGRSFADSAPILERYWAVRAGLGWRGRSGLIVIPRKGTFFVLGELFISTLLPADSPLPFGCGQCHRCIKACPTKALSDEGFDPLRCLSYLTIEQPGALPEREAELIGNRFYGCDTCQLVCPHNRFASPTTVEAFAPKPELFSLNYDNLSEFNEEIYQQLFAGSAVKRAGFEGLKRNAETLLRLRKREKAENGGGEK
ncbi:MAG: tRNA epoxyqueuosine(34) reductase QueG [Porphyromonas sp.]|nr:tRNA epoxyqueuosine(34) reductase QueG [Porphyromonas sp.]